ncbi:MAG: HAMP domain-containing protein [Chloroflexi bacterium]|nr:HAMP domain-containing protein [Chloroflexota bacterium]
MNRLWIRLSLSFTVVLLAVLSLPIVLFWLAFLLRGPGRGMMMTDAPPEAAFLAPIFFMLILATIFSAFVGVVAGIWVSRSLSKQVTQLVVATQEITPNNLATRVTVNGVKELQELAASFNRMVAELDQSQQVRRNMLADVSHELLTPLTVLEGNLRAMLDGVYALNKEEISALYDQTHHMIALIKELRQLTEAEARQLPLNLEKTSLNEIVEETITLFEPLAKEKGIALRQVVFAGLPTILVDRQRLRQIMGNLLANGLHHTPEGGGVITIQTQAHDDAVRLIVEDTGVGLTPEEAERIFDRFYRAEGASRRDVGGAGLGLAIVKALVEAHGGAVWAQATPTQHTQFVIAFPYL